MFGIKSEEKENIIKYRQQAGIIIQKVLHGDLQVRVALLNFPKDIYDESVKAAWHALCHLGSDEELRLKDTLYAEEQDLFLKQISHTLMTGGALPDYVTDAYKPYYDEPLTPHKKGIKGFFAKMRNFLVLKK